MNMFIEFRCDARNLIKRQRCLGQAAVAVLRHICAMFSYFSANDYVASRVININGSIRCIPGEWDLDLCVAAATTTTMAFNFDKCRVMAYNSMRQQSECIFIELYRRGQKSNRILKEPEPPRKRCEFNFYIEKKKKKQKKTYFQCCRSLEFHRRWVTWTLRSCGCTNKGPLNRLADGERNWRKCVSVSLAMVAAIIVLCAIIIINLLNFIFRFSFSFCVTANANNSRRGTNQIKSRWIVARCCSDSHSVGRRFQLKCVNAKTTKSDGKTFRFWYTTEREYIVLGR